MQEIALQFNQYSKGNPHLPSAQVYKTIRVELMGDTINKRYTCEHVNYEDKFTRSYIYPKFSEIEIIQESYYKR